MWRETVVRGGGVEFFTRTLGQGDDVAVLLHGWPQDGTCWRHVAPILADAGMRVVCPDLKGFGASDAPKSGYDPETLADEISQLIRGLHVRWAVLVGHDWGGAVAIATAFRHPGRVRGLVVVNAPYRQLDLRRAWHIPLLNVPVIPEVAFATRPTARRLVAASLRYASVRSDVFDEAAIDQYTAAVSASPRAWLRYYRTLSRRAVVDWAACRLRLRLRAEARARPPLRVPATVVWGSGDPVAPLLLGEQVARDLGADLEVVTDAGHFVPEEAPEAVARAILRLAASVPLAPAGDGHGA